MSNIAKSTIGLMIATIIAKILGFGRELVLASSYGASMYSDAYLTAMNIPLVIFTSISTTLATVLIPMYFKVKKDSGEKCSLKFINNIFNIVIVICILMSIFGFIFVEQLVKIFAVGFEGETLKVAVQFTRITILSIIFLGLSCVMRSYLQANKNFTIPGLISVPKNIIIIISIILSTKYSPYIMIWGTFIGTISEFLFQLPFAFKYGYKYEVHIDFKDKYIKEIAVLIIPVLIGVGVNQVNSLVDKTLASTLLEGSISALNYANRLKDFVMALFITSIGIVIYPLLSELSTQKNTEKLKESVTASINSVILIIIPISVGAIVLSTPIVKVLFQRGEFNHATTKMTATALSMYSIGMIAFGLSEILGKVFYSLQDTKTPMINGMISMVINIILNFIFIKVMGLAGLPLATSISSIICILLLFISLKKKIRDYGQIKIFKTTIKSVISAIIMGLTVHTSYNLLNSILGIGTINEVVALMISIVIGIFVYGVTIIILKVDEIEILINNIKRIKKVA